MASNQSASRLVAPKRPRLSIEHFGIDPAAGEALVDQEDGLPDHLPSAAQVEIVFPGGNPAFQVGRDPSGEAPRAGVRRPGAGEAGDIPAGMDAKQALVVEVGCGPHAVEEKKSGGARAGHGDEGGEAGAGGHEDRGPPGPSVGEIPVRTGESEGCARFGGPEEGGEAAGAGVPDQEGDLRVGGKGDQGVVPFLDRPRLPRGDKPDELPRREGELRGAVQAELEGVLGQPAPPGNRGGEGSGARLRHPLRVSRGYPPRRRPRCNAWPA